MRVLLNIINEKQTEIPVNYQYPVSAWIYKVFNKADGYFAHWLHEHGYAFNGDHKFKLFNFSHIKFEKSRFDKGRIPKLIVEPGEHRFEIGIYMEDAASRFIKGLFEDQNLDITQQHVKGRFSVKNVEVLPEPEFTETVTYKALSPVLVTRPRGIENGKLQTDHLSPEAEDYEQRLKENILRRYTATHQHITSGMMEESGEQQLLTDFPFDPDAFTFELTSKPKSKLQAIKAGTPQETKLRGFLYSCKITAPIELHKLIWHSGLGEKGSLGFGTCSTKNIFPI